MSDTINIDEINSFFKSAFAHLKGGITIPQVTRITPGEIWLDMTPMPENIRPGGFINGPTQMALADHAGYVAVFGHKGITPMAMTSNLNIDFLRPAKGETLHAHCKTLKMGRKLGVFSVTMYTVDEAKPVSHAMVTYVMPDSELS